MRKSGQIVVGVCFLGIGIGFAIGAIHLQIGRPTEPQPGFFPFLDGLTLVILSAIFLFQALGGGPERPMPLGSCGGPPSWFWD